MKKTWKDYTFVLLQALLIGAFFVPVSWRFELPLPGLYYLNSFLMGMGLVVVVLGFMHLRTNLTPFPTPKTKSHLVTSGIFSQVRHPIYTGLFLLFAGWALRGENLYQLLIAAALLLLFFFKSQYEERQLDKRFPQYEKYKARTGRFIPKLGKSFARNN